MHPGSELLVSLQIDLSGLMGTIQNIVAFVVVFGLLVFFHELGHFLVAKWSGVKVHEFALGFGPALFKKQWGETLYAIRIIPLGGFVRLAGMEPTENLPEESVGTDEEDGEHAFHRRPASHRIAILAAGPAMNFLLTIGIYTVLFMTLAISVAVVQDSSPAEQAGLQAGDLIVGVNDESVRGWNAQELINRIQAAGEQPVQLEVVRNGATEHIRVTPEIDAERGVPVLGVELTTVPAGIQQGPVKALVAGVKHTGVMISTFYQGVRDMITGSIAPEFSGPIGIYQLTGRASQGGPLVLLQFAAILSLNLAILNLLPIPVLDGGGLLFVAIEVIRGRPLSSKYKGIAQLIGLSLLLLLMLYATMQDIEMLGS